MEVNAWENVGVGVEGKQNQIYAILISYVNAQSAAP